MASCSVLSIGSAASVLSSEHNNSPNAVHSQSDAQFAESSLQCADERNNNIEQRQQQVTVLRVFMTDIYFSVNEKLLERLQARLSESGGKVKLVVERNIKNIASCDIVIGDRHGIPYHLLRGGVRPLGADKPLLNFFQGAQNLTLKVSMAKLLKEFPAADRFCPKSFVLYPTAKTGDDEEGKDDDSASSAPTTPLAVSSIDNSSAASNNTNNNKRRSALPSKAERMALAAAKNAAAAVISQASNTLLAPDDRDALAAEMSKHTDAVWIAKPTAGSKGIGIMLSRNIDDILRHVDTFNPQTAQSHAENFGGSMENSSSNNNTSTSSAVNPKKSSRSKFVVQRYIDRPLLVKGMYKFDIRVWCALASPPFEVYVFSEGSCRLASSPYAGVKDLSDLFAHVTNHDLQQFAKTGFSEVVAGNEMWYSQLECELQEQFGSEEQLAALRTRHGETLREINGYLKKSTSKAQDSNSSSSSNSSIFEEFVRPQLHHAIVQSFLAAKSFLEIPESERFQAQQQFGFDLMLDDELNVHLLEINGAPGVAQCLLHPLVDGAIDTIVAPRVSAFATPGAMSGWQPVAGRDRMGHWDRVF